MVFQVMDDSMILKNFKPSHVTEINLIEKYFTSVYITYIFVFESVTFRCFFFYRDDVCMIET